VRLEGEDEQSEGPRWIQVAEEGKFLGHPSGAFELDREAFGEIVKNFRAHPSFEKGSGGLGSARVVPFDIKHASEEPASAIAVSGAPAHGWALDLEVREGDDGKAELWALAEFIEPMASWVLEGRYRWTSVAIWPNAVDPKTGKEIGWYMSSIAVTNDPFIQGMVPIAAERMFALGMDLYSLPATPHEMLGVLRQKLGLGELATAVDVGVELAKLRDIMAGTTPAPPGVDALELLGCLRQMLSLPLLATPDEVFGELDRFLAIVAAGEPEAPQAQEAAAPLAASNEVAGEIMQSQTLERIAKLLGVPVTAEDAEAQIVRTLEAGTKVRSQLSAILNALEVEDPDGAIDRIAKLVQSNAQLMKAWPQLKSLAGEQVKAEEEEAEEDVEKAMAAHRLDPATKPALLYMRRGEIEFDADDEPEVIADKIAQRKDKRARFLDRYPITAEGQRHLLRQVAVTQKDQPARRLAGIDRLTMSADGGAVVMTRPEPPAGRAPGAGSRINLDAFPGVNPTEQAMAYVRANGGESLTFEACHEQACMLLARMQRG
jgi:hypothetical protein